MNNSFAKEFTEQSLSHFWENTPRIEKCFNQLSEEEIWTRPNSSSNSIANLVLHLCGNITQYIISSLHGSGDERNRDLEFTTEKGYSKSELVNMLKTTVENATVIIKNCSEEELLRKREVQGFQLSGIGIIIHVVEHYSYHTGQIAFYTKQLKDLNLNFYEGIDLNKKNSS